MKKYIVVVILGLVFSLPARAMSSPDDEVTIRVMEMHEHSKHAVMQFIELPAKALEQDRSRDRISEESRDIEQERTHQRNIEAEQMEIDRESIEQHGEQFQQKYQAPSPNN